MFDPLTILPLAQTSGDPIPQEAYRQVSSLTLMFAILTILLIMTLSLIVVLRRSQRRKATETKPQPTEYVDAWAESAKRFDPSITEINPDDDD